MRMSSINDNNSRFNLIPTSFLLATDNKSDIGKAPTKPADTPAVVSSVHATDEKAHTTSGKKDPKTTATAENWNPIEDGKMEKMKAFFKDDEGPKVKFYGEEFNKDCLKYGFTKTLKDSRWAEPPKGNITQDEPRKDGQKSGSGGKSKGLKDSRWAK